MPTEEETKAAADAAAKATADAEAAAKTAAGTDPPAADDVASLPDWAQKLIGKTRTEAATNRTKAGTANDALTATRDAIAKALGLKEDDDPVAAAKTAAEERDAARTEAKATKIENAVLRAASKNGANPERLTDSRAFMRTLEAIDPTADDFAAQVDAAIKTAVETDPSLKGAPVVPGKSGGEVIGGGPIKQSDDPQQRARDYYESAPTK
jgi:hypothetical protein